MATDRQIAANRLNALKSTGPRTPEGKARSRQNAFKHGLTGKAIALPTEEAQQLDSRITAWIDDLKPQGASQTWLVHHAALASWRLDRCARTETAQLALQVRHAEPDWLSDQTAQALALGATLNANPAATVARLQTTAAGCGWLIARWKELGGLLRDEGFWHYPEKFRAIRLLGRQLDGFLEDATASDLMVACHKLHPEPWELQDDVTQALAEVGGGGVYERRVEVLAARTPATAELALKMVWNVVHYELGRLTALQDRLTAEHEAADRAEAGLRAMFNDAPSGPLLRRYEVSIERALHQALGALIKLRKSSPGPDEHSYEDGAEPVFPGAGEPAPEASAAGSSGDLQQEPKLETFVQVRGSKIGSPEVVEGVDRPCSGV